MSEISRLSIDNENLFDTAIGDGGVSEKEIEALSPKLDSLRKKIKEWTDSSEPTFLNLPFSNDIKAIKRRGQKNFTRL